MFRRILTVALLAGFLGGLAVSVIQEFTTSPIILHAEQFESKGDRGGHQHGAVLPMPMARLFLAHGPAAEEGTGGGSTWAPEDGFERTLFTTLANVLTGVGFALILVAAMALSGREIDGRSGLLWGIGGFVIVGLAPALGLPPEVPGSAAAELVARQSWWALCAIATAAGLWMLVFREGAAWTAGGIIALILPHAIGAPLPSEFSTSVPPELAAQFVSASLVTTAIFWAVLGWLSGTFWKRYQTNA